MKANSGGWKLLGNLNSVEAYDHYENKWTNLPCMIEKRRYHASVTISNKLFVVGGYRKSTCEVFDSFARRFCYIKHVLHLVLISIIFKQFVEVVKL